MTLEELTHLSVHCLLHRCEAALDLGIVRIDLQALLVGIIGANEVTLSVQSGAFPAPALDPIRLDLCGFRGICKGAVPLLLGSVGS